MKQEIMKVLFVCTGNVFRSMSAEYLMRKYLEDNQMTGIEVSSAGTTARPQLSFPETIARLQRYGCDATHHHQTKLTKEVLADKDLVICMSECHRIVVRELGYDGVLFNEIAYGKAEDLMDDTEFGNKYGRDYDIGKYAETIVDYIHDAMPLLVKNIFKK